MTPFTVTTEDRLVIAGRHNNPGQITKRLLALHMRPATKESYLPLMEKVEPLGWLVAAIDFRGHGESTQGGRLDHNTFTPGERQKYLLDAQTALGYLAKDGPVDGIIGASIGANIALQLQAASGLAKSVLLSAGLDYWGVLTLPAAGQLQQDQACYLVATTSDRQTAQEARQIYGATSTPHKAIDIYPGAEHGTDILVGHPERLEKIMTFLKSPDSLDFPGSSKL